MQPINPLAITPRGRKERGAVLMGSVILLTLMTLIGLTSIKSSILEEKMAGNNREKYRSFELAEMTLAQADRHLVTQDDVLPFYAHGVYSDNACSDAHPTTNGLYQVGINSNSKNNHPWSCESVFSPDNSLQADIPNDARKSAQDVPSSPQPRYMIGLEGEVELDGMDSSIPQKFFRFYLTAQAKGGVTTIKTTLQAEALRAY
jgi:type IV pilus assembly protein PilX